MKPDLTTLKAVIFDMDGVLYLSDECHALAYASVFQEVGIENVDYRTIAGMRTDEAIRSVLERLHGSVDEETVQRLTHVKRERAAVLLKERARIAPGSAPLIRQLQKKYRLALVSSASSQSVDSFLERSGYADAFEFHLDGSQVVQAKPAPDCYRLALEKLGLRPDQCVVVEDSENGVRAARTAGIPVLFLAKERDFSGFRQDDGVMVVSELMEVGGLI